jgi:DNA-binding IclR family transcriptional regulator
VRTWRIEQWLRRDYSVGSYELASQLLDRLTIELAAWSIVTETDRLEAAALKYAAADLRELAAAVELALLDWRDLLVSVGDD